jgi:hypothetical protein
VRLSPASAAGSYERQIQWEAVGEVSSNPGAQGSFSLGFTKMTGSVVYNVQGSKSSCTGVYGPAPGARTPIAADVSPVYGDVIGFEITLEFPLDENYVRSSNTTDLFCMLDRDLHGAADPASHPDVPDLKAIEYDLAARPRATAAFPLPEEPQVAEQEYNYEYTGPLQRSRNSMGPMGRRSASSRPTSRRRSP